MLKVCEVSLKLGRKRILDGVSFGVSSGEFVVITGPNGSGKSSLARVLMGLVRQSSGEIFLNGEEISDLAVDERARKGISFSFQQPVKFKGITIYNMLGLARGELISPEEAGEYLNENELNKLREIVDEILAHKEE